MFPVYSKMTVDEHYTNFRKHNMILGGQPVGAWKAQEGKRMKGADKTVRKH